MTMQRWDPFREMRRMEDQMNRLWRGGGWGGWQEEGWNMPVDVMESQDQVTVKATVPGYDPDDIKITYENGTLTIRAEGTQEHEEQEGDFLVRERRTGSMYRVVSLPDTVDVDGAESTCENGVLTITFPKAEEKRARHLQIKKGAGARTIEAEGGTAQGDGPAGQGGGEQGKRRAA